MKKNFLFFAAIISLGIDQGFCSELKESSCQKTVEVKPCFIGDISKHESNQNLLKIIIEEELASMGPEKSPADYLMSRISHIAKALLNRGFSIDAYELPSIDEDSIGAFNHFVLWEGQEIPLTFFAYTWPSEEFASQYFSDPHLKFYYGTIIHSHPIPCAFAILKGTFIQGNYELIPSLSIEKTVRLINEDIFQEGEMCLDDLKNPFIHQLYSKGTGSLPAISLHAYGLPSKDKVRKAFEEHRPLHSYILETNE